MNLTKAEILAHIVGLNNDFTWLLESASDESISSYDITRCWQELDNSEDFEVVWLGSKSYPETEVLTYTSTDFNDLSGIIRINSNYPYLVGTNWLDMSWYGRTWAILPKDTYQKLLSRKQQPKTQQPKTQKTEQAEMTKQSVTTAIIDSNKTAAKQVLVLGVGQAANKAAVKAITPALPIMARGYADTVIGKMMLANIANLAVLQFAPENEKAATITNAMIQAAMMEVLQKVNINELIDNLIDSVNTDQLNGLMKKSDVE